LISKQLYSFLQDINLNNIAITGANYEEYTSKDLSKNLKLIAPEAVYFFNKKPLILFFDIPPLTDTEREKQIHKKVWSFDNSPIIFIIKNSEIKVFNALNFIKSKNRLQEINLTREEIIEQFSLLNLESGEVWKSFQNKYLDSKKSQDYHKRVNDQLFENIKDVRLELTRSNQETPLKDEEANSLILRIIFIRYLIDREIEIDERYISGISINLRRKSFSELIKENHELNELFNLLNEKFNGVLFRETHISLTQKQADYLSNVFKGEVEDQDNLFKDFFFEIFDFSIIPVEVISGIYESLIDEETRNSDSAVYTPSFLVDYVLNDTVDKYLIDNNTSECKVFEVAVGSGIFLVQSLRRMIEREIELNGRANKKVFSNRIREIAKRNLFGIDINNEALKVTCFSIYIALLDYQDPKDINQYSFPNFIGENLFNANFFGKLDSLGNLIKSDFEDVINQNRPEFILGNPPWKSKKDDEIHTKWLKLNKKTVGRFEIAQSFLLRVSDFMSDHTISALVVTSTMFFNVSKKTQAFKKEFLTSNCIHKILDLSPVRRLIFEQKSSPASIVYFNKAKDADYLNNIVHHVSVKWNYFLKHFKMLVIEKYDQKQIAQKHFIENAWMFKVALYGNTLDFSLLKRIQNTSSKPVHKLVDAMGAGIMKGDKNIYPVYNEITDKCFINNSEVSQFYSKSKSENVLRQEDCHLKSGKIKGLYNGFQILYKEQAENESKLVISIPSSPVVFRKGVFGLSSQNKEDIEFIYSLHISRLYEYHTFLISGSWGTSTRPQIRWKEEFLSFPIIEPSKQNRNRLIHLVNLFLKPLEEYHNKFTLGHTEINQLAISQINEIVNKEYFIKEHEKDQIDYALNISRYQFQSSKQHLVTNFTSIDKSCYRNRKNVLKKYIEVYLSEFQNIYNDEYIQVEVYPLKHFIALNFVFVNKKPQKSISYPTDKKSEETVLKALADNLSLSQITDTKDPTKNLFIQKDIKGFEKNSFYIIKPNEYKCWHRAMAWYDVAEFKEAIQVSETNLKTKN
jgi:hypothetical protein